MAPEQVVADPNIDHRADIYAAGIGAYEMLTGALPFSATTPQQVLAARVTDPELIAKRRPDIREAVAAMVMKCLVKEPDGRWQTADELLQAVGQIRRSVVPVASPRWRGGRTGWLAAAALGLVAALGLWAVARTDSSSPSSSRTAIAVLPFTVAGGDDFEYLSDGIVNLLSTSLDGAGGLRSVNAHALLGYVTDRGGVGADEPMQSRLLNKHSFFLIECPFAPFTSARVAWQLRSESFESPTV